MEDHKKKHTCWCWNHDSELCQHKHKADSETPDLSAEQIAQLNAIIDDKKNDLSDEEVKKLQTLFGSQQ